MNSVVAELAIFFAHAGRTQPNGRSDLQPSGGAAEEGGNDGTAEDLSSRTW